MILRVTSCSSTSSVIVRVCVRMHVCYELGQSGVCSLNLGSPQNSSTLHSVENTHSFSCCQNALSSSSMPNSWDCSWQACLPPWCWRCTPELCRGPLGPSSTWWTAVLANTASRWSGGTYVCGMLLGDGKKDVFKDEDNEWIIVSEVTIFVFRDTCSMFYRKKKGLVKDSWILLDLSKKI